jgi:glycosyltransferase involved in cell wall biosynthesis
MRIVKTLIWFVLDCLLIVTFSIPFIVYVIVEGAVIRRRRKSCLWRNSNAIRILRLPEGSGDLQAIFNKYKSLDVYFYNVVPGCTEIVVNSIFWTSNYYTIKLRQDFVMMESPYFSNLWRSSFLFFFCRNLWVIRYYQANLIHANNAFQEGLMATLLSKVTGVCFCVSIHTDYDKNEGRHPYTLPRILGSLAVTRAVEKFVLRSADRLLPISDYLKQILIRKNVDEDRIRVFYHGIQMDFHHLKDDADVRQTYNIPPNAKIVSWVARIDKDHYVYDLLQIAIGCVSRAQDVFFVIAGDGLELPQLKQKVQEMNLSDRIVFPGLIANNQALMLRLASWVNLCLFDGFGLIEACASGRPVVAYDVEWNYELIINGETGFLVKEYDIESAIESIGVLLDNPDYALQLGIAAQKIAIKNHSIENVIRAKAKILKELIGACET